MTRRTTLLVVACAMACSKDHESERDKKGRSSAIIASTSAPIVDASADARPDPKTQIEGAYVTLAWPGKISKTVGAAPPIGTACTLTVHAGQLPTYDPFHDAMTVTCGDKTLFDEHDAIAGATRSFFEMKEYPVMGEVSAFRYELHAYDEGARTGRNQIETDTRQDGTVTVYSETIPTFRVTIKLDAKRDIRRGKPLYKRNIPPFNAVSKWTATMTSSKGALPFAAKTCELRVSPGDVEHNCRVQLECAKKLQYGADFYDTCDCKVLGGELIGVNDLKPTPVDGDPSIVADLLAKTATFADEPANGGPWSASFTLAPID